MIVTAMLIFILMLPLGSIWIFRFYDSQLVRDTENELIAQGAFVKAMLQSELSDAGLNQSTLPIEMPSPRKQKEAVRWIEPQLELTNVQILPSRAEARKADKPTNPVFRKAGEKLTKIIVEAQKTTLAGFRVVDPNGVVIAGGNEIGLSLAHVPEVQTALAGNYVSVIRKRDSDSPRPPIYSISRGTDIRVFVAMPIEYRGHVAGAVYLSRTPSHFLRELYGQRWKLAGALVFLLLVTLAVAALFVRTIKGPIDALNERTKRISTGDRSAISPLPRHGTREIADLSHGLLSMSQQLQNRADYIRNFANHVSHELKSPITSIRGAAELMQESAGNMNDREREKFLANVLGDAERMTSLLERLRELAAAENLIMEGTCNLEQELEAISGKNPHIVFDVKGEVEHEVAISSENLGIVLDNLIGNAIRHEASEIEITCSVTGMNIVLELKDNGSGISPANRKKVFDLFFTTTRDHGGTGMGLNIVKSVLEAHGGSIKLLETDTGTAFELTLPAQHGKHS